MAKIRGISIIIYLLCRRQSPTLWTELTTYDLVSRGTNTSGTNQCYGTWNNTTKIGYGPSYQYACIHSGVIKTSGDLATNWYNYVLATAGTIVDENTSSSNPATNMDTATESICPKGWTLASKTQIDSQRNVAVFSPVKGGSYNNASLDNESTNGYYFGSEAYDNGRRYGLTYDGNTDILRTSNGHLRRSGTYIRCVQKST